MTTHDNATAARLSSSGEAIVSCGVDVALCATRDATVALRLGNDVEGAPRGLLGARHKGGRSGKWSAAARV